MARALLLYTREFYAFIHELYKSTKSKIPKLTYLFAMTHFNRLLFLLISTVVSVHLTAQEWDVYPVPASPGSNNVWELQENVSDDFNYSFNSADKVDFGDGKWYNFYHNGWDGPGTTYWKYDHVSVDGDNLSIRTSRWDKANQSNPQYPYPGAWEEYKMGKADNGVNSGCVTSNAKVKYPVYVEAAISVANIPLASCFWLLSPSDKQEIDIIENYGGVEGFQQYTHISHHSFIRASEPEGFHDYQPRDWNSWWPDSRVSADYGWGDYCWNAGHRRYMRMGVYWIDPFHFEYYVDGELVRIMYYNAIATRMNGTWEYTYYNAQNPMPTTDSWGNNIGGMPTNYTSGYQSGYSEVTLYATSGEFSYDKLKEASAASNGINVVDPGNYQDGNGFTDELDIIINVESQSWLVARNATPTDEELNDPAKNKMLVDWVRVYKPVESSEAIAVTGVEIDQTASVMKGKELTLSAKVLPENATNKKVIWKSSDESIATIDEFGKVTAIAEGDVDITVTTDEGPFSAVCKLTVTPFVAVDVTGVELDKTNLLLVVQGSELLTATVAPDDATNSAVSWKSSNTSIADVNENGVVTAKSAGTASITVTTEDGNKTAICEVLVVNESDIITVEAEDYIADGGDFDDDNGGGVTLNPGAGISHVNGGDWAEYTLNVPKDGKYKIAYYVATTVDGASIGAEIDGTPVSSEEVNSTGGWAAYEMVFSANTIDLTAGTHTLKITTGTADWQWNLDKVDIILIEENSTTPVQSVELKKGWNLIGCPLDGSTDIKTALSSIWDNVELVKDFDGFYKLTDPDFSSLNELQWGKGYFVKVSADCTLTW